MQGEDRTSGERIDEEEDQFRRLDIFAGQEYTAFQGAIAVSQRVAASQRRVSTSRE